MKRTIRILFALTFASALFLAYQAGVQTGYQRGFDSADVVHSCAIPGAVLL